MLLLIFQKLNYLIFLLAFTFLCSLFLVGLGFLKFVLTRDRLQNLVIIRWLNRFLVQMN
jgi:hypothetical protein